MQASSLLRKEYSMNERALKTLEYDKIIEQ